MKKAYLKTLQKLCRREIKKIGLGDGVPGRNEIVNWHDFMAIECVNQETATQKRMLGVCVGTLKALGEID